MEDILICLKYYCSVDILKQECIPVGCIPSAAVAIWGCLPKGVSASWGVCLGGVSALVGCLLRGVSAWGSVYPGECLPMGVHPPQTQRQTASPRPRGRYPPDPEAEGDTPLWTEFLTHACENITFPQLLLRMVNMTKNFPRCQ